MFSWAGICNNEQYSVPIQQNINKDKENKSNCFTVNLRYKISYFFVKERVDKREVKIEYFPTKIILVDYVTKQLKVKVC